MPPLHNPHPPAGRPGFLPPSHKQQIDRLCSTATHQFPIRPHSPPHTVEKHHRAGYTKRFCHYDEDEKSARAKLKSIKSRLRWLGRFRKHPHTHTTLFSYSTRRHGGEINKIQQGIHAHTHDKNIGVHVYAAVVVEWCVRARVCVRETCSAHEAAMEYEVIEARFRRGLREKGYGGRNE